MKRKLPVLGAFAVAASCLTGCQDHGASVSVPKSQSLDTAQVLALAQKPSESGTPFEVNDGALTLTDTSESAEPIDVNAMP